MIIANSSAAPAVPALMQSLAAAESARLTPFFTDVTVEQGRTLVEEGEAIEYVWFPDTCVASAVVTSAEGRATEVGVVGFEGAVGLSLLFGAPASNITAVVQIAGKAKCMRAADFSRLVVAPRGPAYDTLARYSDAFLSVVARIAACNNLHSIDQRLARWILMAHDRVHHHQLPVTQEFIGYMLGVRRASISSAAAALQQAGVIHYARGRIVVSDRAGLERRSCPCYSATSSVLTGKRWEHDGAAVVVAAFG